MFLASASLFFKAALASSNLAWAAAFSSLVEAFFKAALAWSTLAWAASTLAWALALAVATLFSASAFLASKAFF